MPVREADLPGTTGFSARPINVAAGINAGAEMMMSCLFGGPKVGWTVINAVITASVVMAGGPSRVE